MRSLKLALMIGAAGAMALAAEKETVMPPSVIKKLTVEQLMDIDVTSVSKRPERLFDAASAIQVITAEDVRRSGATSLPEALRLASNLEVARIDSRQWAITARGFNNVFADKMLVLIDGRTVYTPLYAGVYWDVQDTMLADLDRIEVISGPGATQWGANAVNGVINITTKNAKDTQGTLVSAGGGIRLHNSTAVRYGGSLKPGVFYRVYVKYFERGDSVRPSGTGSNDAWRMGQGGFRIDGEAAAGDLYTVQGDTYSGYIGLPGPDSVRVRGGNVLGRWTHRAGDGREWKLQAYFDHTYRRIPSSFAFDIDTGDLDFQSRLPLAPGHDVVWGLGYRVNGDDIQNTAANAFLPPKVTRQLVSVFAQDEITLRPEQLTVTIGSKVEHNDYTGFEVEPSIRVAWTPDRQTTFWAALSRAVRTPSRVDRDLFSPATPPYRIAGGKHVVSEKLIAYEAGYRVQINPGLAVSLATFFSDYDDLRSLEPLTPPISFPAEASSGLQGR
ncbi:MAG TPA: TonB-dependent receptor, partial [Planctomycetaceae bacterium]|nr:TonB-dependent receptor [Planctomycetaceae bacterium]